MDHTVQFEATTAGGKQQVCPRIRGNSTRSHHTAVKRVSWLEKSIQPIDHICITAQEAGCSRGGWALQPARWQAYGTTKQHSKMCRGTPLSTKSCMHNTSNACHCGLRRCAAHALHQWHHSSTVLQDTSPISLSRSTARLSGWCMKGTTGLRAELAWQAWCCTQHINEALENIAGDLAVINSTGHEVLSARLLLLLLHKAASITDRLLLH
jgi:hypothetical protein